jgi:alpha-1,3-mannosyltransferase
MARMTTRRYKGRRALWCMSASKSRGLSSKALHNADRSSYPALHLYIYTALHQLLPSDSRERPAQFVFLGLYIFNLLSISTIYYLAGRPRERTPPLSAEDTTTKVSPDGPLSPASPPTSSSFYASSGSHIPQALLIPLTLSKREHSIYLLRLFNDPFAMALLYLAVLAFMLGGSRGWRIGCLVFR